MRDERWFISYTDGNSYGVIITNVTPAHWALMRRFRMKKPYVILYAEQISLALSSELRHMTGVAFDDFGEEDCGC